MVLTDLLCQISFCDAAREAAISRPYDGIRCRSAIERGIQLGEYFGGRILDRVRCKEESENLRRRP